MVFVASSKNDVTRGFIPVSFAAYLKLREQYICIVIYVAELEPDSSTMKDNSELLQSAMAQSAEEAAAYLRTLSNPARLLLLCQLVEGPKRVGELEEALGLAQAYVSQQLARLRADGLVNSEKEGRIVRYSLADERVVTLVQVLYDLFCAQPKAGS
jgi:DNA-binding transcriptional ArsR family regulator